MDRASSGNQVIHGVWILLLFLAGLLLAPAIAAASDSQSWLDNNASITLNDNWRLRVTQEARFVEIPYGNHFLWNVSLGVGRSLPGNMSLAAAYKREVTDLGPITISENRYQVDFGWKRNFLRKSSFDARLRTEYRTFEQSVLEKRFRFRLRLRLKTAISLGRLRLKPFIADEGFPTQGPINWTGTDSRWVPSLWSTPMWTSCWATCARTPMTGVPFTHS